MKNNFTINNLLLGSAIAIAMTGCGGSGSSTTSSTTPSPDLITGVSLSGKALKGIVKSGVVTAVQLDASGNAGATVGSATTDSNGGYSLSLSDSYTGGPIQISITADANTQMKCDVPLGCGTRTDDVVDSNSNTTIEFGEWYKPAALTMTALVPVAASNETLSVNVTPFTHMAAARAKAASTLNAAAVANANSEVSVLLGGVDILNTPPVDITDPAAVNAASATQVVYGALSSSLANQGITDDTGQPDLNAAIDLLASSFAAGTMVADDASGDDAAQISLQEILDAASATFTQVGISDVTGVLSGLQADIVTALGGDGTINPEPSATVADASLVKVKAMMSDVRTWGNVISAEVGTKDTDFETEVNMASDALSALLTDQGPGSALAEAMDAVSMYFDGTNTSSDLTTYNTNYNPVTMQNVSPFTSGAIASSGTGTVTITNGMIYGFTVNLVATAPENNASATSFNMGIQSATVVSNDTSMTVTNGTVSMTLASAYTVDYSAINLGTESPLPKITDMVFDLDVSLTQNTGVDIYGQVADLASPVTFTGGLAFDLDPVAIKNETTVNQGALPSTFELTGTISNAVNSMDMSLVVNVSNTDTFQFEGDFAAVGTLYSSIPAHASPMVTWSYSDGNSDSIIDTFYIASPDYSTQIIWSSGDGSVSVTRTYPGGVYTYSSAGPYASPAAYVTQNALMFPSSIAAVIDGEGVYWANLSGKDLTVDGNADGVLTEAEFIEESATNWIDADIGLTFTAQLEGLPEAGINITADRSGFEAGTGTVTISYGTRQLALSGSVSGNDLTGTFTITNQDNVVFNFTETEEVVNNVAITTLSGTLTHNGVDYGTLEETANGYLKVSYVDGTFEIF